MSTKTLLMLFCLTFTSAAVPMGCGDDEAAEASAGKKKGGGRLAAARAAKAAGGGKGPKGDGSSLTSELEEVWDEGR